MFYVDRAGKITGTICAGQTLPQRVVQQVNCFSDEEKKLCLAKYVLNLKIAAQFRLLHRYSKRTVDPCLHESEKKIAAFLHQLPAVKSLEKLRGLEGIAARYYFQAFGNLTVSEDWEWTGRKKHPSPDPLNALLSYGYSFLERDVRIMLLTAGFDCRFGFLHSNDGRKDSLVFDLMEPFRQKIVDRFVLNSVNKKVIRKEHFKHQDKNCLLTNEGRDIWISSYENYMNKPVREYEDQSPREWMNSEIKKFEAVFIELNQ